MPFLKHFKTVGRRALAISMAALMASGLAPSLPASAAGDGGTDGGDDVPVMETEAEGFTASPPGKEVEVSRGTAVSDFSANAVSRGNIMPLAGDAIAFRVYGFMPEMSSKSGGYFGGRGGVTAVGLGGLKISGIVSVETRDYPGATAKLWKSQPYTWQSSDGVKNVVDFIKTDLGSWKPACKGLAPKVTLSGDVTSATQWTGQVVGEAAKGKVYGRVKMTWAQTAGQTLIPANGTMYATSADADSEGWLGLPYTDSLLNAYARIDSSSANTEVTSSTKTQDLTSLVNNGSKGSQTIYTNYDALRGESSATHTDQKVDLGTFTSQTGTFNYDTSQAGKYMHVTFTTYGGNKTTKTVQIPPAYQIIYDSQGGSAVESSSKVFTGYSRSVTDAVPTRLGYKFLGWYTAPNAGGLKREAGYNILLTSNVTLYAAWKVDHQINTEAVNGNITPSMDGIDVGATKVVTYSPNEGYRLQSITVDGKALSKSEMAKYANAYTFRNIQGSHTIKVVYGKGYNITTIVENGWIDPEGVIENVPEGTTRVIEYGPDDGYKLKRIQVDGKDVSLTEFEDSYTFPNIHEDHVIKVSYSSAFMVETYVENGTITDSNYDVNGGDDEYVQYSPDEYAEGKFCRLVSITVDGQQLSESEMSEHEYGYNFPSISDDHTIEVIYEKPNLYNIYVEVIGGTTETPVLENIEEGGKGRIKFKKDGRNEMTSVTVNGVAQDLTDWKTKTSYQFTGLDEDKYVVITYEGDPVYKITTAVENGTIMPDVPNLSAGSSKVITYSPNPGYKLARIEVDDQPVDINANKNSYTFTNINENHTIYVVYVKVPVYSVSTEVIGGTITESRDDLTEGSNHTVTYTPDEGYELDSVTVDGEAVDITKFPSSYPFVNITGNHDISVVFTPEVFYSVTTSVVHGRIDESKTGLKKGSDVTITYEPEDGYVLRTITVDGSDMPLEGRGTSYRFMNLQSDRTIHVVFEKEPAYSVTTSVENGTITPSAEDSLKAGSSYLVTYTPKAGYQLTKVTVDGEDVDISTCPGSYEFTDIREDHTIHVVFSEEPGYTVTTHVTGGTITPTVAGAKKGTDVPVTYSPDEGYELESVTVDGSPVDISTCPEGYTFQGISEDHEITVVFREIPKYTITTSVEHGTIDETVRDIVRGTDVDIHYSPEDGYHLGSLTVDGQAVDVSANLSVYHFSAVSADHTIKAVFVPDDTYTVTTHVTGGTITDTVTNIRKGTDVPITYAPDEGYELESVTIDGNPVDISTCPERYTFPAVSEDHEITVVFREIPKYTITTSVEHGTITETKTGLAAGSSLTVTYSPDEGYHLASVTVDGDPQDITDHPSSYGFTGIDRDHRIHVVFEEDETYTVTTEVVNGTIDKGASGIKAGSDVTVRYSPDEGYTLAGIEVDGAAVAIAGNEDSYMFRGITSDHHIKVIYSRNFRVSTSVEGGTIDPSRDDVEDGEAVTVTYHPEGDKYLESLTVDGEEKDPEEFPDSYTFPDIHESHSIHAVFADYLEVTTEVEHGTIEGAASRLKKGADITVTYQPEDGYHLGSITVDGEPVGSSGNESSYRFAGITRSHHIKVVFVPDDTYTVTATVEHGTIEGGKSGIRAGSSVTVTYAPEMGYHLKSVAVDGKAVDITANPSSYTFTDIRKDHAIHVIYEKDAEPEKPKYKVETSINHGEITKTKDDYPEGSDVTIDFRPADGFYVDKVVVDGKDVDLGDKMFVDFPDIDADHTVTVICKPYLEVTTEAVGGTITGSMLDVKSGETREVTYSPDKGYHLEYIEVDGERVPDLSDIQSSYAFSNITANHHIKVVYAKDKTFTVTATVDGGTISGGKSGLAAGSSAEIVFSPDAGHILSAISIDGQLMPEAELREKYGEGAKDQKYVFTDIQADHSIHVVYTEKPAEPEDDEVVIEIWKSIEDTEAVAYAKGTPVFQFRIDGYDSKGNRVTLYRTIVLEEGVPVGHVSVTLPEGNYHVTELECDGWDMAGTARTQTAEVLQDGSGVKTAKLNFTNKPVDYKNWTGNASVVNKLKK